MDESTWTLFDVIVAGILVSSLVGGLVFATRKTSSKRQKYIAYAVIFFVFAFIWGELAVGLIGSPIAGD